ncbi:MAG: zinc ribbon domain-containing protein, partial [Erysipelotrichales bacterium]|nr:zinc ribbon domain-containing protein [Erysipelotrichales bacterium]
MSFLKRAIRNGISDGIGKAVGDAITKAVEPKATELANKAAARIEQEVEKREAAEAAQQAEREAQVKNIFGGLESAFADLEKAATGYATEMSKNYKICANCGKPSEVDKKFCPACGSKLPEETLAQGAVCTSCGKQNDIGTKFCSDCGTKLPAAVQEEEAAKAKDDEVMVKWDEVLVNYPKWNCGGKDYDIEQYDIDQFRFCAQFEGDTMAAQNAVK